MPTRATTCSMLRALVRDGVIPLLGPPTSIGDVHHGALYYYLLSPAAFLTGGDSPLAVTALIAFAGIAAVLVTWWLARSIGGPDRGSRRRRRDGGLDLGRRRIHVHLEPEPHRPVERDRAGRCVAGLVEPRPALVAPCRRRDGDHDAVPRAGRHDAADRRGVAGGGCPITPGWPGAPAGRRLRVGGAGHRGPQLPAAGRPRADHELLRGQRRARLHPVGRRPDGARAAGALPRHRRRASCPGR